MAEKAYLEFLNKKYCNILITDNLLIELESEIQHFYLTYNKNLSYVIDFITNHIFILKT